MHPSDHQTRVVLGPRFCPLDGSHFTRELIIHVPGVCHQAAREFSHSLIGVSGVNPAM